MESTPSTKQPTQVVELVAGCVWEIMTENGTRHLLDYRNLEAGRYRMRVPSSQSSEFAFDGVWQARVGPINEVEIGAPVMFFGPGVGDMLATSHVVSVRSMPEHEVPPLGEILFKAADDE